MKVIDLSEENKDLYFACLEDRPAAVVQEDPKKDRPAG